MSRRDDDIGQLEAAIAAQEGLRATLGDAIVDVTVAALRLQLAALQSEPTGGTPASLLAGSPERFATPELAFRMRESGRARGELRQVTVVFADLSGHVALGEILDPEELATLSNDVLRVLAEAVYAYEGTVDAYLGDSALGLFGAPIAHEDDPVRALHAALMMREHLEGVNRTWMARLGEPLTLHVGANTGIAVAGQVGNDLHLEYTVIGDTINIASRLQEVAPAGEILVSRETYRLTRHAFIFDALEPITVKGKRAPVPVYALRRARLRPLNLSEREGQGTRFVGRTSELAILRAIGNGVRGGHGRVLTVSGEAGIGKSRLLAEWRRELGDNVHWLEGRSLVHAEAIAYAPIIDLIRRLAGITDDHSEAQARDRLRQALATIYPEDPEVLALFASFLTMRLTPDEEILIGPRAADWRRQRLTELIQTGLVTLSQDRPIVFVLEDVHWADASTIDLVRRLLPLVEHQPIVMALVIRSTDETRIGELIRTIQNDHVGRLTSINLRPLTEEQSVALIGSLLAQGDIPPRLCDSIVERTAGNPFYMEEVVRSLIERGVLVRDDGTGGWTATSLAETVTVPDTLQGLLMSRLDRLPAETKWTIQQAAVIGRTFLYRVLRWIAENAALDSDLSYLEREELIRQRVTDPELEYIFKHALTQEIAYSSLLAPQRRSLHQRVGEALEAIMADRLAEYHGTVASHYWRGEAWDKASQYLIRAGDAAAFIGANPEARRLYADCLAAISHLDANAENSRRRVDTLLKLVEVSLTADQPAQNFGRLAEAEQTLDELAADGGDDADRQRRAWLHLWRGRVQYYLSDIPAALRSYDQVLALAEGTSDRRLLTYPYAAIGVSLFAQGQWRKALPLLTQALQGLDESSDRREWMNIAHYRAQAVAITGDYQAGLSELLELNSRVRQLQDQRAIAFSYISLTVVYLHGVKYAKSCEAASAAAEICEASGDRIYQFASIVMRQLAETWAGRLDDADASYSQAKAIADAITGSGGRTPYGQGWPANNAELALARGDFSRAISLAEDGLAAVGEYDSFSRARFLGCLGQALAKLGPQRWDEAKMRLSESIAAFESSGAVLVAARLHAIWARLCHEHGDPLGEIEHVEKASAVYDAAGLSGEL
jgi:class 3 adenylate cyclase/tetratricopeptide (TPR) repeat protein